jgi:FkbM family methyltransferase
MLLMKTDPFRRFVRRVAELPSYLGGQHAFLEAWLQEIQIAISKLEIAISKLSAETARLTGSLDQLATKLEKIQQKIDVLEQKNEADPERAESFVRLETGLSRVEGVAAMAERMAERRIQLQTPWKPEDLELAADPEFGLMAMLYSFLPSRIALDVGANVGRLSKLLLDAGFVVYAFEPFPKAYDQMMKKMAGESNFKAFPFALGSKDGVLPLHIASGSSEGSGDPSLYNTFAPHAFPEGIALESALDVPVKTIKGLVDATVLPRDIGLVKIDTEGFDFEVVIGLGDLLPPIVVTEFWGDDFVLAKDRDPATPGHPNLLLREMRSRGYWWSLMLFRVNDADGSSNIVRFTCNSQRVPRNSWGNVFFFREHEPFVQALRWCSIVLPGLA